MVANSAAEIKFVDDGERGNVRTITVLVLKAVSKSIRSGRTELDGTPFRSAMRTCIPRALPMFATRLPAWLLDWHWFG